MIKYLISYLIGVFAAKFLCLGFNSAEVANWFYVAFCLSWGFTIGEIVKMELKNENKSKKP